MRVRSRDKDRQIIFPSGRTLTVSPKGTDVPKSMEDDMRKIVPHLSHIEEDKTYVAPKAEVTAESRPAPAAPKKENLNG